jgi:hypothetical protein
MFKVKLTNFFLKKFYKRLLLFFFSLIQLRSIQHIITEYKKEEEIQLRFYLRYFAKQKRLSSRGGCVKFIIIKYIAYTE